MELQIDASDIDIVVRNLEATPTQAQAALRSTLPKMARWLRARSVKGLSRELDVQQTVIRRRLKQFRLRRLGDAASIDVWYGLDPIALIHLKPRQTRRGVKARSHLREGAFIASGKSGNRQVFKRRGKERLPIDRQTLDIGDKARRWIEDSLLGVEAFERQFLGTFEHELRWRMQSQKSA